MADNGFVSAVIVAAGSSRRMGGVNKLLLKIGGVPVLCRTVEAFQKNQDINEIIIAARQEDIEEYSALLAGFNKVKKIVPGGNTRQQSVAAAIEQTDERCELLAIHDGARPLVSGQTISKTVAAAAEFSAAACGVRVKDTIKVTDSSGFIAATPERASLWAVQTPQCFNRRLYLGCVKALGDSARELTDDCQIVEQCAKKVKMVEGEYSNIKITTAEDIPFAESLLKK